MIQLAFYAPYKNWLSNQIFDPAAECNVNDVGRRWAALRDLLAKRGIAFNTWDSYPDQSKIDYWLMSDPWPTTLKMLWYYRINPRRVIMMLSEPHVVNPWGWRNLPYYGWMLRGFITWHSQLTQNNPRFQHVHFPCHFDPSMCDTYRRSTKRNLALMMHSNKLSREPGEHYSLRRDVVRHFERRGDRLLDLYGFGWNDPRAEDPFHTNLYAGTTNDKRLIYSQYHYALCIDNCVEPGYVTYDPLIAMATGTVPVYKPMPDSKDLIPEGTFIDYDAFQSLDDLIAHMQALVASGEIEGYRQRGWAFLNSPKYRPFTIETFCEDMCSGIEALIGRRRLEQAA